MDVSQFIHPMRDRKVSLIESIDNGFLVRFQEATERKPFTGLSSYVDSEAHREPHFQRSRFSCREVCLYCAGIEEVKAAVEKAAQAYATMSELTSKGELDDHLPGLL